MTRLAVAFAKPHPALLCFVTAGDGDTAAILDALVSGGADVIELGMPFTDPMADGPAIQQANLRSLGRGTTTALIFDLAAGFRQRHPDVPLVLMGYANPMTTRGPEWFAGQCAKAGVDGPSASSSSGGMSTQMTPSIPALLHSDANQSAPRMVIGLA